MPRVAIPKKTRTVAVLQCRRRCCICFGLNNDAEPKAGQFAHLDHDPSNNAQKNIAYLCLVHHDQYDGKTSQSASITKDEVVHYRDELYRFIYERSEAFRSEVKTTRQALDYWTFRKGPSKAEIDAALDLFAGAHRTRSVLLELDQGPKTLSELLNAIPGATDWVEGIINGLATSKLIFGATAAEPRYKLAPAGERILRILDAIPDFIKNAAWDANWRAHERNPGDVE